MVPFKRSLRNPIHLRPPQVGIERNFDRSFHLDRRVHEHINSLLERIAELQGQHHQDIVGNNVSLCRRPRDCDHPGPGASSGDGALREVLIHISTDRRPANGTLVEGNLVQGTVELTGRGVNQPFRRGRDHPFDATERHLGDHPERTEGEVHVGRRQVPRRQG